MERQNVIDSFGEAEPGSVLVCQVQAGGTGVNLQAASAVIFCEPQIKPSLEKQAAARVHRMGQTDRVLAIRLISEDTVDEAVLPLLEKKQAEFDAFAEESAAADAAAALADQDWIRAVVEEERQKYLPAVVPSGGS
jgi:SNF2 family DNA or RNA helicase